MRFAFLLRNRQSLLMQVDPSTRALSSASTSASAAAQESSTSRQGIKRAYSQQAAAVARPSHIPAPTPPPTKLPRAANLSGEPSPFSDARRFTHEHANSMSTPSAGRNHQFRSAEAGPSSSQLHASPSGSSRGSRASKRGNSLRQVPRNLMDGPYHNQIYIEKEHNKSPIPLKPLHKEAPKGALNNFYQTIKGKQPEYVSVHGTVMGGNRAIVVWRTTVSLDIVPPLVGIGDHADKKTSVTLAALSAVYQLQELGILEDAKKLIPKNTPATEVVLSDSTVVRYEQARSFMDYYCRRYSFPPPDIDYVESRSGWEAIMTVGGRRIGLGAGSNKKTAQTTCYLDVTKYLESCDPELWKTYVAAAKTGKDLGMAPKVRFQMSPDLEDAVGDLCFDIRKTSLYRNRPLKDATVARAEQSQRENQVYTVRGGFHYKQPLGEKSKALLERRKAYLADPKLDGMRKARMSLPVFSQGKEILLHIENNDVTICMAATGSGKTTQIPQMVLDEYIERGEGAKCNIICTQPRRLAAISVAARVAKERGENLGKSIGYQVRFEMNLPERDGSVTFCTTGVFLKRLQTAMLDGQRGQSLDSVTHIIVDEVHERDVDTDLLLVVLKQLMAQKKAKNQKLKIILMSATIDPTLFQKYFANEAGHPADVVSVPGRSYPVKKYFLEDYLPKLIAGPSKWVTEQDLVARYLHRELGPTEVAKLGIHPPRQEPREEDLELPYPLIASTIAHVLNSSEDGHVLVFLPGWEEISSTQKALLQPLGPLGINFNSSKYSLHLLHSTIPLAEQQVIFEPPAPGVRRVILATNIAETSITIPDVVYVIDTAKIKEQRYDPDRHMSSLVSAWVGSSNLNQRAGRAGRHRSGEYFGILSKAHAEALHPYQTVEMKRVDLSNVVMHVKALNLPGMTVEDVLAASIEPPDPNRVDAAIKNLQMVGALDSEKGLTSLGRVLLQLPVEAQMGRLVLYGSFFRCLDPALTLAAILTSRDPFVSPMHLKKEAAAKKNSWAPDGFRSDALAILRAFNAWWAIQSRGEYNAANKFCIDNFLAKPTLLLIQKVKAHLLQSLYRAGVIDVSAGGQANNFVDMSSSARSLVVPPVLNANQGSLPLLAALIAIASQPKFGIRTGERTYRTPTDKGAIIHPSSVNHRKRDTVEGVQPDEKQLYAYAEKRRNESGATGGVPSTYLVTTTRLDPLAYILFGAYHVEVTERGLECDDWLPIVGDIRTLDEVQRLKTSMEACMLRVFEGIIMQQRRGQHLPILPREEEREFESGDEDDDMRDYCLSMEEIKELDILTSDVVTILNRFSDERIATQSRQQSRAATPIGSPFSTASRLPLVGSGYSTPTYLQSRPGTPSRFRRF